MAALLLHQKTRNWQSVEIRRGFDLLKTKGGLGFGIPSRPNQPTHTTKRRAASGFQSAAPLRIMWNLHAEFKRKERANAELRKTNLELGTWSLTLRQPLKTSCQFRFVFRHSALGYAQHHNP